MFCKLFLVVVFLHTTAIYANQLKEIQQLYSAIEKRDLVPVQTEFRDFFASWKICGDPTVLKQISNNVGLYQLCADILGYMIFPFWNWNWLIVRKMICFMLCFRC